MVLHVLERTANRAGATRLHAFLWRREKARELARGLPGTNTSQQNRLIWDAYDWSDEGEEWSVSAEWRRALIEEVMLANLPADAVALEIGPGAARWSVTLARQCRELVLVDVSERAIELSRDKLRDFDNVSFHLSDGSDLPGIDDASIDFVWSFDVFVHIAAVDQEAYLRELARVMRPSARAVIHHAGSGGVEPHSWRSGMSAELFAAMLERCGLKLIEATDRWGSEGQHRVPTVGDTITIFER